MLTAIILVLVSCIFGGIASLMIKKGAKDFSLKINAIPDIFRNWRLIIGMLCYIIGAFLVIAALKLERLSLIYPLTSVTYIFVALLSAYVLKEKITWKKIIGILLIVAGAILVAI